MARVLIVLIILAGILWFLHWFRTTPAPRVSQVLRQGALWGLIGLLILAAATGRLSPILAAIGALVPLLLRAAYLAQLLPLLQRALRALGLGSLSGPGRTGPSGSGASSIRTQFLEMRLDHTSGAMDGQVLDGPFKGRQLSDLILPDLLRMYELYREADHQSAAVLEAYLDRERAEDWRDHLGPAAAGGRAAAPAERLTKAEAWSILGLEPGADTAAIRAAHRRLMQRLHPDRGGSDYLAAKINEAKRLLLGESGP
ncbi:molecular chaperone DnaJ [Thiocapsa imhoffii]|uniref:Molecular chaperone DnaJ n=1 Tax=Thiocapsa imhoffii TaxID=382777 RepID=A0A9X0WG52_9GAMM|nr:molecular chaperone DnaJ [Thiocapsa imhoffii]MBK1643950.1 molecular chaperone DnaJ [Thiocapsa imhoffii]